jgi:O-antigen/teichoic acid export membrane protein
MNYTKALVRGSGIVFIVAILSAILGYLLRILLARNLTMEEYGLFYAVFAFVNVIASFRGFGVGQALIKYIPEFKLSENYSSIKKGIIYYFSLQFISFIFIFGVIFIFADNLAVGYFKDLTSINLLFLLALASIFSIFESLFHVLFLGYKKSGHYAFTTFFQMLLVLIITLILLKLGIGYLSPAYGYLIASILSSIIYYFLFRKMSPQFFNAKLSFDFKFFKKLTLFGLPLTASAIIGSSIGQLDILILTYFTGLKEVALYSVALPISMLLRQFSKSISLIIIPVSSEIYLQNRELLIEGIKNIHKYILITIIPIALVMAIFAPLIISLFFGDEYLGAVWTLRILAVSAIFYSIAYINSNILLGIGKPGLNAKIMIGLSSIALILDLFLIPLYGIIGAALGIFIASFVMFFVSLIYIKKDINYFPSIMLFIKLLSLGGLFLFFIKSLRQLPFVNYWVELIVLVILGGGFYFGGLFLFRIISVEEIKILLKRIF